VVTFRTLSDDDFDAVLAMFIEQYEMIRAL
jgi:hypothetical protein